jgi:hypothetical protein
MGRERVAALPWVTANGPVRCEALEVMRKSLAFFDERGIKAVSSGRRA